MMLEEFALVVHVLGWVFWLGTDLGVLLTCRYAERGSLSVETRLTLLEVGMILDRLPRFAVPLVWGSGAKTTKCGNNVIIFNFYKLLKKKATKKASYF